jgi:hypothetical protein
LDLIPSCSRAIAFEVILVSVLDSVGGPGDQRTEHRCRKPAPNSSKMTSVLYKRSEKNSPETKGLRDSAAPQSLANERLDNFRV